MIWTRQELIELSGYKQKAKIATWLRSNGFAFYLGRDGWPRVLKSNGITSSSSLTKSKPDLKALQERQRGATKKAP